MKRKKKSSTLNFIHICVHPRNTNYKEHTLNWYVNVSKNVDIKIRRTRQTIRCRVTARVSTTVCHVNSHKRGDNSQFF